MRFNEFKQIDEAPAVAWQTRPGTDSDEYIDKPAYQRKGVNPPITTPKPGTKPVVNLADPKQAAAYNASIGQSKPAVWKNNRTGVTSSTPPVSATPTSNIDRVGMARPGEPTMGQEVSVKPAATPPANTAAYDKGYNAGKTVRAGIDAGVNAAKASASAAFSKKAPALDTSKRIEPTMGTTPPAVWKNNRNPDAPASTSPISAPTTKPATTTAPSQYQQAMNTVANMRKGMSKSNEYTNIYAPLGPTSFQNRQYVQDLEKEFRKTPNDPVIRAELDKMRGPGIVAAKGTGNAGGRTTDVNDPRLTANIQPGSSDIRGTGRGTGMQNDPRLASQQSTQPTTTAVKPIASTGTSAPAQSAPTSYKGSAGAQAIQQANSDKITDVNKITAGDTIKVGGQDYTIKQGDTLDSIAKNQLAPSNPSASTDNKNDRLPDEDVSSVQADESKSLNRIKSLAGLK